MAYHPKPPRTLIVGHRWPSAALLGASMLLCRTGRAGSPPPELGYDYQAIESARTTAMGGAQRALASSTEGLWINPAGMAAARVYHVGALAQFWPEAGRQTYGAAAVDSIVSASHLAGGLGATWNRQDPDGIDRRWTDVRFALAYPFSQQFMVGIGGRYLSLRQDGLGPLGFSYASGGLKGENIVHGFGLDAGVQIRPSENLSLGFVANNLNSPDNGFQPTSFGGGASLGNRMVAVEVDAETDVTTWSRTTWRGMGGISALLGDKLGLQGGYRYDEGPHAHALSLGVGYLDRSFSIELGGRRTVTGPAVTAITIDLRYFVESSGLTPAPSESF